MTIDKTVVLENVCRALIDVDDNRAAELLRAEYPFEPATREGGTVSKALAMKVFVRDGFIDRYSGQRVVFPAALRALSILLPKEFPYHPNWKLDACHFAYYEICAVVDHVAPRARSGGNELSNLVTTSSVRNSAKSNFTLAELGWPLLGEHETQKVGWSHQLVSRYCNSQAGNSEIERRAWVARCGFECTGKVRKSAESR